MEKSEQRKEFESYCSERTDNQTDPEFPILYRVNDAVLRTIDFNIGLVGKIKGNDCYIFYLNDPEEDKDYFTYMPCDYVDEHRQELLHNLIQLSEIPLYQVKSMNIFEYASLLRFFNIHGRFRNSIEENWDELGMDSLIDL